MTTPDKTPTKTTAHQRADQIHAFQHELAVLLTGEILTYPRATK